MPVAVRRYTGLLVRFVLLVVILWGSNLWLVRIRDSMHNHRSVLRGQPSLQEATMPLVQQVVVIVVGGLRYDASLQMPFVNHMRQDGFEARCMGHFPSYSQSAWTTLISGAGPEISDAPLVNAPGEELRFLTVDGLFAEAKRAHLTTALAGYQWWQRLIPEQVLDAGHFVATTDAQADGQVVEAALHFLDSLRPNLLLVHLSQADHAARTFGANSKEYRAAVRRVDSHVREIAQSMSLTRNVLVVAADHGYLSNGGHGGGDEEVLITPLVMTGGRVAPGPHADVDQADIAPTIAALLGLAVPSAAQGQILFEALLLDEAESTEKWVSWAQQRVELGNVYLESIGGERLSESTRGDAQIAHSSLVVRNYGSARSLAGFAVQEAEQEMTTARAQRINRERQSRLPIGLLVIGVGAYVLWRRWSRTTSALTISALATVLIYNLLFVWEGHVYSFSGVGEWNAFLVQVISRMATALIPSLAIMVWIVWRGHDRTPVEIAVINYSFALILALLLALPLLVGYIINGSEITWYMPDPLFAYLQVSALSQLGVAAFLLLLLPLVTVPVHWILRWIRLKVR